MDVIALFKEYGFDVGSILAILMLTPIIKNFVVQRYVSLIPVVMGTLLGVLNFMIAGGFDQMAWYQVLGGILKQGIVYGGVAMGVYNIYKKSILNK